MIKKIRLKNFKGFKDAELELGPLNILIGANASGKSNIRDAFRFLHGITTGMTLAEIIGGTKDWEGIRGGTKETIFKNSDSFEIEVIFDLKYIDKLFETREEEQSFYDDENAKELINQDYYYKISIGINNNEPKIIYEKLSSDLNVIFESKYTNNNIKEPAEVNFYH